MTITRRRLLTYTAALPLLYRSTLQSFAIMDGSASNHVDILLRGLFFMEYQTDKKLFFVATPLHNQHCFLFRDEVTPHHPGGPQPLPNAFDLTTLNTLKQGPDPGSDPFSTEILHFSCADITHSPPFIDSSNPKLYACLLTLPYPKHIIPLRCGSFDDFHPNSGNVAKSINKYCGGRIATVVWLRYEIDTTKPPGFGLRTCYAEHAVNPEVPDVNCALSDAQKVFPQFDLRIVPGFPKASAVPEDLQTQLPSDIDPHDEDAFNEQNPNPCPEKHCISPGEEKRRDRKLNKTTLEVANCPIFGVIH